LERPVAAGLAVVAVFVWLAPLVLIYMRRRVGAGPTVSG